MKRMALITLAALICVWHAPARAQIEIEYVGDVTRYNMRNVSDPNECHALVFVTGTPTSTGIFRHKAPNGIVDMRAGRVITKGSGVYIGMKIAPASILPVAIVEITKGKPLEVRQVEEEVECRTMFYKAEVLGKGSITTRSGDMKEEYFGRPIAGEVSNLYIRGAEIALTQKSIAQGAIETRDYGRINVMVNTRLLRPKVFLVMNEKLRQHIFPNLESDSAVVDTSMQSKSAATAEEPLYPMSEERKAKLISYSQFKNVWRFVEFFVSLGILTLLLVTGFSAKMRNWAKIAKKRFFVVWLFLIMVIVADYILSFPFHVYRNFIVENNCGFMNQTFIEWWGEDLLSLLIGAIIGIIPMWFFYWLVGRLKKWWLWFSIGAIPFAVFFIVIAPVVIAPLFNKYEPLKDKQLESEILSLASKAGIEGSDVFQVNASKQSTKINAYVTGLFGTKRIVLYDTMIDNFEYDEIKFVMGHEMGHYVMHHVWWGLLVAILFIAFALWLTSKTIQPVINRFRARFKFDRLSDIASLPLVMIYLTIITFAFQPVTNGVSRIMEHQADKYGMDITDVSGVSAAIAFDKLSVFNLSDPDPHWLIEFWFYDHPALKKRMAFVRGYRP